MTCIECSTEKPPREFYGSNKSRCKACVRARSLAHRRNHLEAMRAYDRERSKLPHRVANGVRVSREWRRKHRDRLRAHNAAARAQLSPPIACEGCGLAKPLNKHHHDYSRPLVVVWLCKPCHVIADKIRRRLETA